MLRCVPLKVKVSINSSTTLRTNRMHLSHDGVQALDEGVYVSMKVLSIFLDELVQLLFVRLLALASTSNHAITCKHST